MIQQTILRNNISAKPSVNGSANFNFLEGLGKGIGHGAVICLTESDIPLSRDVDAIPIRYL